MVTNVPDFPKKIIHEILPSANPFTQNIHKMIEAINGVCALLPDKYEWRYRTSDAYKAESECIYAFSRDALSMNTFYWRDQLGNWEAYSIMNTLRVIDLVRSCIWALNRADAVCCCLLARSALETTAAFVDAARIMHKTILEGQNEGKPSPLFDPGINLRTSIVVSKELEEYSLKTIFSSRLPEAEKIYSPTNILTIVSRISKSPGQEFLKSTYEILCEAAHPNMLGRALYIHECEPGPYDGNELRSIGPGNGAAWPILIKEIAAALAWSCGTQASSFRLMQDAIEKTNSRLRAAEESS